ncbi:MAG: hypothetical protein ABFS18_12015 [Thermodesulfobacteriota bacterium]
MKSLFKFLLAVHISILGSIIVGHESTAAESSAPEVQPVSLLSVKTTGLTENLVVILNDQDKLLIKGNGLTAFEGQLEAGDDYKVKVLKQPLNHHCELKKMVGRLETDTTTIVEAECRETGRWSAAVSLVEKVNSSGRGKKIREPAVSIDNKGNGLVVWTELDKEKWSRLVIREYRDGKWHKPTIMSPQDGDAKNPRVAQAGNGDAVVVWEHRINSSVSYVMVAERRNGVWKMPKSAADRISIGDKKAAWEAEVAINDTGDTVIVWSQETDNKVYGIYKSEYRNGKWLHPKHNADHISPSGGSDALEPQVAINNKGVALIAWGQPDDKRQKNIYKSEFRDDKWIHPSGLKDYINMKRNKKGLGIAYRTNVALDEKGNGLIAWEQAHDNKRVIFVSEYRQNKWRHPGSTAEAISPASVRSAMIQDLKMDGNDNAILLWKDIKGRKQSLYKSEYRQGKWRHPLEDKPFVAPSLLDFNFNVTGESAMAADGKAVVAWMEKGNDKPEVYMAEYDHGEWHLPGRMLNAENSLGGGLRLSSSSNGKMIIAWQQLQGNKEHLYSRVFKPINNAD